MIPQAHQNRFHADTVKALAAKFSGMSTAELANLSADDRELCEDFLGTYKNLNKGIKGRGKGRNVAPAISPQGSVQQPTMTMYAQMLHGLLPLPQLAYPSHHGKHHPHPQQLHSLPADRGGFPLDYNMVRHGGEPNHHATQVYGIFDVDYESGAPLSTLGTHYEEDNAQSFPLV